MTWQQANVCHQTCAGRQTRKILIENGTYLPQAQPSRSEKETRSLVGVPSLGLKTTLGKVKGKQRNPEILPKSLASLLSQFP